MNHKSYFHRLILNILSIKGMSAILSAFGALWLCVEISEKFLKITTVSDYWLAFFLIGFGIAVYICRPLNQVVAKLKNRDINIEIVIGNLFNLDGDFIIGSNSTFDTKISPDLISEQSIQGQFTTRYYGTDTANYCRLDDELDTALKTEKYEELNGERKGKKKRYSLGTIVKLFPKNRIGYFVAIADLNEHGTASGDFNQLKDIFAKIWLFIGERGTKNVLIIPVLGSGFTRLNVSREEIIREIIKSFIAACSEKTFTDKLTIVLSEKDVSKYEIDLDVLGRYLNHICTYTEFSTNYPENKNGTPISKP